MSTATQSPETETQRLYQEYRALLESTPQGLAHVQLRHRWIASREEASRAERALQKATERMQKAKAREVELFESLKLSKELLPQAVRDAEAAYAASLQALTKHSF